MSICLKVWDQIKMWTKSYFLVLWSQPWCWCVQMCKSYQRRPHQVASEYFEPKQKNPKSFNWDALLILEGANFGWSLLGARSQSGSDALLILANFWLELSSEPIWLVTSCPWLHSTTLPLNVGWVPAANTLVIGAGNTLVCTVMQIDWLLVVHIHWLYSGANSKYNDYWWYTYTDYWHICKRSFQPPG